MVEHSAHRLLQKGSRTINTMPIKDRSHKPLRVTRLPGEHAAIGSMDSKDRWTMQRLRIIDLSTLEDESMEGSKNSIKDLVEFTRHGIEAGGIAFGVYGTQVDGMPEEEKGELQGWVTFYQDDKERIDRLKQEKILGDVEKSFPIIEVSYAKFPGTLPGQIADALRQACSRLSGVNACIDEWNHASNTKPSLIITAYVDPKNIPSIKVLERAGFVRRGEVPYSKDSPTPDYFYLLDWDKHAELTNSVALSEWRDKLEEQSEKPER